MHSMGMELENTVPSNEPKRGLENKADGIVGAAAVIESDVHYDQMRGEYKKVDEEQKRKYVSHIPTTSWRQLTKHL